jgi:transposase
MGATDRPGSGRPAAAREVLPPRADESGDRPERMARQDPLYRRLMTAPGVGELTALVYRAAVDDPSRFVKSRTVGARFGMTPRTMPSGKRSWSGRISRRGDNWVRRSLVMAARGVFRKNVRQSWLTAWAAQVAARRGAGKAIVAVARRLSVILNQMWVSGPGFYWDRSASGAG